MSDQSHESLLGWAVVGTYERQIAAFEVKKSTNSSSKSRDLTSGSIQLKGAFVGGAHLKPIKVLTAVKSSKEAETISGTSGRKRSRSRNRNSSSAWVASAGLDFTMMENVLLTTSRFDY